MIIYSIVPAEIIFQNSENIIDASGNKNQYKEMEYLGHKIQVSKLTENTYTINRLISTSPQAFLDQRLQPGTIIDTLEKF
jgi:hypothetical protein